MSFFRSRLVLRCLATLLVVGVASTLAPTAVAQDARAEALRSLLNDAAAFEVALEASRSAGDGGDPLDAFVEAYVQEADGPVDADVIYHLIEGAAFGWMAPVGPDAAFVPSPTGAPSPLLGPCPQTPAVPRALPETAAPAWPDGASPAPLRGASALQPRAP